VYLDKELFCILRLAFILPVFGYAAVGAYIKFTVPQVYAQFFSGYFNTIILSLFLASAVCTAITELYAGKSPK
jgi:polyferredoxin